MMTISARAAKGEKMAGKARPSLRKKTLENVMLSNLSVTDKECIKAVFEEADSIVRCKECVHYNVYRLECHNKHMNGINGIDGFCSWGERRSDG